MEKWMVVYVLPLEVWMDIFCFPWISRANFGRIVDRIGNFKFAEHAQFYLHEWGKHKLGDVNFDKDGLFKLIDDDEHIYLDIPQTPLPENIKSFDSIEIQHFDSQTIAFLGHLQPLLTDVELHLSIDDDNLEDLRTILTQMVPLLDSIHSLHCYKDTFPLAKQLLGEKLDKSKRLQIEYNDYNDDALAQENVNSIMDWLTQPRDGPRWCETHFHDDKGFAEELSIAIREQFLASKSPCTFAVKVVYDYCLHWLFAEFHAENGIGEELHSGWTDADDEPYGIQIVRYPKNSDREEVLEWIRENTKERGCGRIELFDPTIGPLDAPQLDMLKVDEEDQAEQQKPSTSKDA